MPIKMIGTFLKLVVKAFKFSVARPLQRFHIEGRSKKYLGEEAKYFMPAPRAIGSLSQKGASQYPHLKDLGKFKSVAQRRMEAIASRNQKLLEESSKSTSLNGNGMDGTSMQKSFSEIKQDDDMVIEASNRLPVVKTVTLIPNNNTSPSECDATKDSQLVENKPARPLPKSTNLQLSDPAVIWHVDKVPPGRLNLTKLQEIMINKLSDSTYWTQKRISDTYNIKEAYAENLISYLGQIVIIVSPHMKNCLDIAGANDPAYQATKDIIYCVDYSLRTESQKVFDETFLPTDELEPEVRRVLSGGELQKQRYQLAKPRLADLLKRPEPLRLGAQEKAKKDELDESLKVKQKIGKQLNAPSTQNKGLTKHGVK